MTGMLASVTSVAEAKIVLTAGVDIIDIKNPHEGALGALDTEEIRNIVGLVKSDVLTSATIGDITSDDPELLNYIINMAETGVDYVKVGMFDKKLSAHFIRAIISAINKGIKIVVVLFAENYQGLDSVRPIMQSGITGIMLDTKDKQSQNLCSVLNNVELIEFIDLARKNNLLTGLAGSLRYQDIKPLLQLNPDYLGFRGALCKESDRVKSINSKKVNKIRMAIPLSPFNEFQNTQFKEANIG